MNFICCALIVLATIASSFATPVDPCQWMRCANGPCVNGKCTNNKCGPNMHKEECGSSCPARCDFDPAAADCISLCKDGCFCDAGFVLDKLDGVCIRQEDCPKQENKREENKCDLIRCQGGQICKNGQCVRNPKCPLYNLREPKEGCTFSIEINERGCPFPKEHCAS